MKINRGDLLKLLTVSCCGLSAKETLEQSDCFVFSEELLVTFNGEVFTKTANPLPEVEGAIPAVDFLKILAKFPDDVVDVVLRGDEIVVRGQRRSAGITLQADVLLPFRAVPKPGKKWKPVPETMMGVLRQASLVCGRDETQPRTTEVHITADRVEACDNFRMFRYSMQTGFSKDSLIPATSLDALSGLLLTHVSQKLGWIHFKNSTGHQISLRGSTGEFPDLTPLMGLGDAVEVHLPKNLGEILGRAAVMQESSNEALVHVSIEGKTLTLKAAKRGGWFKETKRIQYSGVPLSFQIHPKFLSDILTKTSKVQVGSSRMRLEAGEALIVVCLEVA